MVNPRYLLQREIRKTLELLMRARKFQFGAIFKRTRKKEYKSKVGYDRLIKMAVATEGFGLVGAREPVSQNNVQALAHILALYELDRQTLREAGYSDEEIRKILAPARALIKISETVLYIRGHNARSIVAPLSEILAREAILLEKIALFEAFGEGKVKVEKEKEVGMAGSVEYGEEEEE